ncbi:MAG: hypothetical protein HON23_02410 [Rickettsiales bacterium]|jgi:hypothetical protein|nr:hypothetical protein [Rickettsiales bacterium]
MLSETRYGDSLQKANKLLLKLLDSELPTIDENQRCALKDAVLTPRSVIAPANLEMLEVLEK